MKYQKVWPHVFFVILVGFFVLFNNSNSEQSKTTQFSPTNNQVPVTKETAQVLRVIDGDTIKVLINNKEETVRLIGIDSPEVADPRIPVQCFGVEASNKAKELLTGKNVMLESDVTSGDLDQYHRFLRYVFLEDGTNFNKLMIEEGFAHEYTYQNNPYKYQLEFIQAEKEARENKRGLWADNACLYNK